MDTTSKEIHKEVYEICNRMVILLDETKDYGNCTKVASLRMSPRFCQILDKYADCYKKILLMSHEQKLLWPKRFIDRIRYLCLLAEECNKRLNRIINRISKTKNWNIKKRKRGRFSKLLRSFRCASEPAHQRKDYKSVERTVKELEKIISESQQKSVASKRKEPKDSSNSKPASKMTLIDLKMILKERALTSEEKKRHARLLSGRFKGDSRGESIWEINSRFRRF